MLTTIPTAEPDTAIAGDTWKWTKSLPQYPASDGWSLSYAFRGPSKFTVTATADGSAYAVTAPTSVTEHLEPGTYQWTARAERDGERYTVGEGFTIVRADPATVEVGQTFNERMLAKSEAALADHHEAWLQAESINGRSRTYTPPADLIRERSRWAYLVEIERRGGSVPQLARPM